MRPLIVFIATLLVGLVVLGLVHLYRTDLTEFWTWAGILAFALIALLVTSFHMIPEDEMLVFYFMGSYWATYVNSTYAEVPGVRQKRGRTGFFDTVFWLPWPLWRAVRLPTTAFQIPIHVGEVYTKEVRRGKNQYPRIRLRADTTIVLRLAPNVARFVQTFKVLNKGTNLAEEFTFRDNAEHPIQGPRLAAVISGVAQQTVLEAVRTAGVNFSWGYGQDDIVAKKPEFETAVMRVLLEPESVFVQGELLVVGGMDAQNKPIPVTGPAALSFDFNIESIVPESDDLKKAIDAPMIAKFEGQAAATREEQKRAGQARGLKKIAEALEVTEDKMEILRVEGIRDATSNTTFIVAGEGSWADTIRAFFQRGRGGRGGRGRGQRQQRQQGGAAGQPGGGPPQPGTGQGTP